MPREIFLISIVAVMVLTLAVAAFFLSLARPWTRAVLNRAPVSLINILGMRLRGTPVTLVIDAQIQLRARGRDVGLAEVERQYVAHQQRIRNAGDLVDLVEQGLA